MPVETTLMRMYGQRREASRARRRVHRAVEWASYSAKKKAAEIFASRPWQERERYALGMFEQPVPDWMARETADAYRTAQAARGTAYGGAPAFQEAYGLTALAEQRRSQMYPELERLAMAPVTVPQTIFESYMSRSGIPYGTATMQGPSAISALGASVDDAVKALFGSMALAFGANMFGGGGGAQGVGGLQQPQMSWFPTPMTYGFPLTFGQPTNRSNLQGAVR